jgi:hypothetical protein
MSLKITDISYKNPGDCRHLSITVEDNGDVHEMNTHKHEDELIDLLKEFSIQHNLGGKESDALLLIWAAVMIYKRGKTKNNVKNVDIDA